MFRRTEDFLGLWELSLLHTENTKAIKPYQSELLPVKLHIVIWTIPINPPLLTWTIPIIIRLHSITECDSLWGSKSGSLKDRVRSVSIHSPGPKCLEHHLTWRHYMESSTAIRLAFHITRGKRKTCEYFSTVFVQNVDISDHPQYVDFYRKRGLLWVNLEALPRPFSLQIRGFWKKIPLVHFWAWKCRSSI